MGDVSSSVAQAQDVTVDASTRLPDPMWKVALASAVGNTIEYYDFTLYATATALVFNKIFFPASDPLVGSLAAFVTFFMGYCARPLGGIIFGHFGDRVGRKVALLITVAIMGLGTFLIGLMPTYASIGIWAPIALIALRMAQGIGIGGEYGGGMVMTVEHAPPASRGFYSSLVHVGVPAGLVIPVLLLGTLASGMGDEAFIAWGWRLPFLFSIVLVALGFYIRAQISETPAFKRLKDAGQTSARPVVEAVSHHRRNIVLGILAKVAESGLYNVYAVFAITYCVTQLHLPQKQILNGVLIGATLECCTLPLFGYLSDRVGRRSVYVGGMIFQALLAYPFFRMLDSGDPVMIVAAISLGLALGHGSVYGAQGAFFSELFPARIRYSGLSLVQQIGPILGGGLSPIIATALLSQTGSVGPVVAYMVAIAVVSGGCALALRPVRSSA